MTTPTPTPTPSKTPDARRPGRRPRPAYLNVVSATIRRNRKALATDPAAPLGPPITVRNARSGSPRYAHAVEILDAAGASVGRLVYAPGRPLACGAVVYVVADHGVRVSRTPPDPGRAACDAT